MYHPAQALVLAAGQRFAGHPWYGVLASVVTMCLTMSWAYRAWLPPRWAFLAALISVQMAVFGICPEWTGYWAASYWGGAVAATGGALVLGALGRLRRRIDVRNSILFAFGIAVLMNSRPFEGLLLAVCATVALFMSVRRQSTPLHVVLKKCVLPGALLLGLTGAGMLYYCWRTTGNAFRLPYQENLRQYIPRRMFIFGKSQPKTYRHAALARFYDWLMRREWSYSRKAKVTAKRIVNFYLGPVLRLAGVMAVCVL